MDNINKLGLGTVQFGVEYGIANQKGKPDFTEVENVLALTKQSGIKIIDTASAYGDAELILGKVGVNAFKLVSKFLPPRDVSNLKTQFQNTLINLKTKSLYGYLAHRPLELLKQDWQWAFLQEKKAENKIKKIGFSLNKPEELFKLLDAEIVPDIVQIPFNFLDRRFESVIKEYKKKNNLEVHSRSVFLQGLLLMNPDDVPQHLEQLKPTIQKLHTIHNSKDRLLNFVLNKDFIDIVIVGVQNTNQLMQLLLKSNEVMPTNFFVDEFSEDILLPMNWNKA